MSDEAKAANENAISVNAELLIAILRSMNGTVDANKLAQLIGAPNTAAARKRVARFCEKIDPPIAFSGSTFTGGAVDSTPSKTKTTRAPPKTPKTPKSAARTAEDNEEGTPVKKQKTKRAVEDDVDGGVESG